MSKSMTTGQKSLALPPDAGETFNPGQKITIKIDETVGYITPDSYLLVNIQNTSSDHSRWTLPNAAGASAIIKTVRIYSTRTGELLETLQNYNQWVSIENQYRHNDITVHQRTQGLGKTTAQYILVANQIEADPHSANPNDVESNQISPVLTDLTPAYEPRQMIIPLKTGILGHWKDQDTAVPVLNMGGLTIELTLAPVSEVCCQMQMFGANADLTNQEVSKIPETKMNDLIL